NSMKSNLAAVEYTAAIWRCRYFWLSLVKKDLRTRYRRSVLGLGWSLLHPIAMTTVICIVFHKMFDMEVASYGPFLLSGLTTWNYLSSTVTQGCEAFFNGESYIRQHPAPLAIYPLRTVLGAAFHFGLALIVVLMLTWWFKGFGNLAAITSLVPTLAIFIVLGWSLAVMAGFAHVRFADMKHLLDIGLQIMFYATPIFIPPEQMKERGLAWLIDYNPAAILLDLIRQPVLNGNFPTLRAWTCVAAITAVAFALAVLMLVRLQRRLIFYL
ncbi:MAG TPA: ABC transporter permease, partial [Pirellulales bacterium]|nr:ABC transporter permease [Pirellulales bacterium]